MGVLREAALVSQVSAGVGLEKGTAEERTTSGGALLAPCRDGEGKRMGRFISDSRFEAGWSRRRKGDSKSAMEERWRGKLLSSLTLKEISQMREGVHANVKSKVITSCHGSAG